MASDDVKRMWVGCQLDEPVHTALLKTATVLGQHPSRVIEAAVEGHIVAFTKQRAEEGGYVDDKILVTALALEDRSRQNQMTQLKNLAYSHMQFPTEESAERLESACNASGVTVETLMEEIANNQHIAELVSENGGMGDAEMWLLENMKPGKKYPMRNLIDQGRKKGFKKHTLNAAKLSLGIESKRESKSWVWILSEDAIRKTPIIAGGDDTVF